MTIVTWNRPLVSVILGFLSSIREQKYPMLEDTSLSYNKIKEALAEKVMLCLQVQQSSPANYLQDFLPTCILFYRLKIGQDNT